MQYQEEHLKILREPFEGFRSARAEIPEIGPCNVLGRREGKDNEALMQLVDHGDIKLTTGGLGRELFKAYRLTDQGAGRALELFKSGKLG